MNYIYSMIGHAQSPPLEKKLSAYIDRYIHFRHTTGVDQLYKNILPCPQIALLMNEAPVRINGQPAPELVLIGLHENLHRIEAMTDQVDSLVIRFTSFGLSRFTQVPVSDLTGKIIDAREIFGHEIEDLFRLVKEQKSLEAKTRLVEDFLLSLLKIPDANDLSILQLSEYLRKEPAPVSLADLREKFPVDLSTRQLARRFKHTIGVNLQTYARLCRFERTKEIFFDQQDESLTQIGLLSGYYDQAHFAREFKKLSGQQARTFFPACSLHRILYEGTPAQQAV